MSNPQISTVTVNRNTSDYTELLLRSFFAHNDGLNVNFTVLDNNSDDDMSSLRAYADEMGVPIYTTEWTPTTPGNNHGENLRDFVLAHPDSEYFLFLDCDIVFVQVDTVTTMVSELESQDGLWAVQARFTNDGVNEIPQELMNPSGQRMFQNIAFESTEDEVAQGQPLIYKPLPAIMGDRVHPCCVLIKNSRAFQLTASLIGFSCAHFEESGCGKVYDTFGAATQVMKTHDLSSSLSEKKVVHFANVSYKNRSKEKDELCRKLLTALREGRKGHDLFR